MFYLLAEKTRQEIDGFGVCMAFHQAEQLWKFPAREEILAALFDGAGVSVIRNIVGDGGVWGNELDGPTPTIEPEEGVWSWEGDEAQRWFTEEGKKRGCTRVFASVWSPPAWMKTNACVHNGGKLRRDCYPAFAEYLARYVSEYRDRFGIELYAISPANEPTTLTQYSSCLWDGEDFRDFLKTAFLPVFRREGLDVKLMIPETERFGAEFEKYYAPSLDDPEVCERVDIVAEHGYGDSQAEPLRKAREKNKPVWLTEICDINVLPKGEQGPGIQNGVAWACNIHRYLTEAEVSCYCFFWGASIYHDGDGCLIGMNLETGTPVYNKRLYTFGNFSRFIRPGYHRVEIDSGSDSPSLLLSAYLSPDESQAVIVGINKGDMSQQVDVALAGIQRRHVEAYRTSETENLVHLESFETDRGCLRTVVPPMSVTTWTV